MLAYGVGAPFSLIVLLYAAPHVFDASHRVFGALPSLSQPRALPLTSLIAVILLYKRRRRWYNALWLCALCLCI